MTDLSTGKLVSAATRRAVALSTAAPPSAAEMSRLLSRLTRKGAVLMASAGEHVDAPRRFDIVNPGDGRRRTKATDRPDAGRAVHGDLVRYGVQRGWLLADATGGVMRLTEAGALALRRGLEGPKVEPTAATAIARQSAPTVGGLTPIARLRQRRDQKGRPVLSSAQAEAAERLARDFHRGAMAARVTSNWDRAALGAVVDGGGGAGRGVEIRDAVSAAQERVRRALDDAGPEFSGVLMDVCCHEIGLEAIEGQRGWPSGVGREVLKLALDRLMRHYGVVATGPAQSTGVTRWIANEA